MVARERLEFDILARTDSARRNVDDLADSFDDAGRSMDDLGDKSGRLDDQITVLETSIKDLIVEFNKTGDIELLKAVKRDKSSLALLVAMRKELDAITNAAEEAADAVGDVASSVVGGGGGRGLFGAALGSPVIPAAIGAAILASPIIGASLNAALLAGVGAGGLGLGIASAIRQSPAVKAEFTALGHDFIDVFDDAGESFVRPLRGAAGFFRVELAKVSDEWVDAIGGLSDVVEPLARGVAGFFTSMTPGSVRALETAEQVIGVLADELPGLGQDVSTMMESFAQGGEGAAEGMKFLVDVIGDVAVATGETVEFLSKMFDIMTDISAEAPVLSAQMFGVMAPLLSDADEAVPKVHGVADGFDDLGGSVDQAARDVEGLNRAMDELLERFLTLDQLELRVAEGFDEVRESIRDNGRTLNINSEQGRANQQVLLDQIDALKDQRQANIDNNMSVTRANDIYNRQYAALLKLAESLGIARSELLKLLDPYNQFQSKTVTLTVRQVFTSQGEARAPVGGGRAYFQHGGEPPMGMPYWVGEAGPELRVDTRPGRILSHQDSMRAIAGASGGGGFDEHRLARAFATELERVLRGATLLLDDRTGHTANLLVRGG